MTDIDKPENPLYSRYAGPEMLALWSERRRYSTWRRIWIVLAQAERELGLPITEAQIDALTEQQDNVDFAKAAEYERRFRHDVMAHLHAFADAAPSARAILHLGATSAFVTDNTDLVLMREGLGLLIGRLVSVVRHLSGFARRHFDRPTLGFTHFQPAQLTTVGKRACLWLYDLALDLEAIELRRSALKLRGVKGATGTQASFLSLFSGDHEKVLRLERLVADKLGFADYYPVTGQTYSRKVDCQILEALGGLGQSAHKFGVDVRLLAHRREIEEPFEAEQIGSSAMAYKRNPMRSERICGLSRFLSSLVANTAQTASAQWLERTLDDSANRRLVLPQAFLAADAVLRLYANVAAGLVVHPAVIARAIEAELGFMATENILMAATRFGGDRQELHERIRRHSHAAAQRMKDEGAPNDLIDRLRADPAFAALDWAVVLDSAAYVGRAPQQTLEFLADFIEPILVRYTDVVLSDESLSV